MVRPANQPNKANSTDCNWPHTGRIGVPAPNGTPSSEACGEIGPVCAARASAPVALHEILPLEKAMRYGWAWGQFPAGRERGGIYAPRCFSIGNGPLPVDQKNRPQFRPIGTSAKCTSIEKTVQEALDAFVVRWRAGRNGQRLEASIITTSLQFFLPSSGPGGQVGTAASRKSSKSAALKTSILAPLR